MHMQNNTHRIKHVHVSDTESPDATVVFESTDQIDSEAYYDRLWAETDAYYAQRDHERNRQLRAAAQKRARRRR